MATYPFTAEALLSPLKIDLGIRSNAFDERLTARIETAMERITATGVTLANTPGDQDLVLMYAAWLWRCRVEQAPMGRMLQLALNNRVFGQAAREGVQGT